MEEVIIEERFLHAYAVKKDGNAPNLFLQCTCTRTLPTYFQMKNTIRIYEECLFIAIPQCSKNETTHQGLILIAIEIHGENSNVCCVSSRFIPSSRDVYKHFGWKWLSTDICLMTQWSQCETWEGNSSAKNSVKLSNGFFFNLLNSYLWALSKQYEEAGEKIPKF